MIPFLEQPSLTLGPITLKAFGAILMIAVLVGEYVYRRRLRALGLDIEVGMQLAWYVLVTGFVGAHLFSLILYFPEKLARNPLLLFKVWEDVSSFGGMIGGAIGAVLFLATRGKALPKLVKWAYLDAAAYVTPFGWAVGRIACSLAHDHPGKLTTFPLAISLSTVRAREYITEVYSDMRLPLPPADQLARLGFHDLGWYEFLYLGFVVVPVFLWLNHRKPAWMNRPGAWVATFALMYAPMRLFFDTLRVADVRYFGFTPGQYAAALLLVGAVALLAWPPAEPSPAAGV